MFRFNSGLPDLEWYSVAGFIPTNHRSPFFLSGIFRFTDYLICSRSKILLLSCRHPYFDILQKYYFLFVNTRDAGYEDKNSSLFYLTDNGDSRFNITGCGNEVGVIDSSSKTYRLVTWLNFIKYSFWVTIYQILRQFDKRQFYKR